MYYFDPNLILIIILSIIAGGLMKGILGLGMPMVAVPVIAYFLPPTTAMMLLCFPILSTNFLQMQIQKGLGSLRFLPLLIFLVIGLIVCILSIFTLFSGIKSIINHIFDKDL